MKERFGQCYLTSIANIMAENIENNNESINTHIPVLLDECVNLLKIDNIIDENVKVFDGTFGGGGYTNAFLKSDNRVFVTATDLDPYAIQRGNLNFANEINSHRLTLINSNFAQTVSTLEDNAYSLIIVDLGFSNNQLKIDPKGFSYLKTTDLLDLRYNHNQGSPVSQFLNTASKVEISKVIYNYSGETFANRIATKIEEVRGSKPIVTVADLVNIIEISIPQKFRNKKNQILSRVWQSLRIHINDEFTSLETFVNIAPTKLKVGGVLAVINFHSLEDKITTKFMRNLTKPTSEDVYGNKKYDFELITKKPVVPTLQEVERNPQSRSATLRAIIKL